MERAAKIRLIQETGIIAILRTTDPGQLISAADAIRAGDVKVIEVTMNTPGALKVIEQAVNKFGDEVLFGAGTVLEAETARAAILAGAEFIVSPTLNLPLITLCHRYSIPVIPGAYTPTEILSAWEAGADMVKLFPADAGGPAFVKAVLAPLPQVQLVPVGGVDLRNAGEFIRAGAAALGVGGGLITQKLLDTGDWKELTRRAAAFIEEVRKARD